MRNVLLQKITPHLVAVSLFIIMSFIYMKPVLEGKQLLGHDTESWMCMAKETLDYNEKHDDVTLWTNSMFGGMPTYMISMHQPNNLIKYVEDVLKLFPITVFFLILYFIGFYILMLNFKVNPWLAIVGSIAFTFASYNLIIIGAGHNSKAITIAYMAPLIGSIFVTFKQHKVAGSLLTAFFLSLAIRANHIQILYYTLIIILFFGVVELIYSIKEKKIRSFLQSAGLAIVAAILALAMNATTLLTTNEYSKYTMRGESNGLTMDMQNAQEGLNREYITQWSYGMDETMTLLIPDFKGGASSGKLGVKSKTAEKIAENFGNVNMKKIMDGMRFNTYWGTQPGTSGPVYLGAIVMLLFVFGLFILDKRILWWLVPMILLTVMLSWGKNFQWLTDIFIDYVPLYNKFRTVSMTLVATGFGITLIAILALKEIFNPQTNKRKFIKPLLISTAITGGLSLVFVLFPSLAGNFTAEVDTHFAQQLSNAYQADFSFLTETLPADRKAMLQGDAFRSLLFIVAAATLIWIYLKDKLKQNLAIAGMGILMLLDLVPVAKRYLNDDNFGRKRNISNLIKPSEADKFILQDKSEFRVLNLTVNIFNDASPSYFHKNIGGYHAAKLRRYQELINLQLTSEIEKFYTIRSLEEFDSLAQQLGVLNMLNMKYIIMDPNSQPLINPYANGNAWFVNSIVEANNADEEMQLLGQIDTKTELVVDKRVAPKNLQAGMPAATDFIRLISYKPNHLVYDFCAQADQTAVFSEIFYDKGWNAYINGKEVPYFRANYLLRSMQLKAGTYQIEFKFEPTSYSIGNTIALISSLLLIICIILFFIVKYQTGKNRNNKLFSIHERQK
ncbi:MAG: YfhO family protein [Paludibacter sp.]|nr:YfhO family protein [Paludibacter sp.]